MVNRLIALVAAMLVLPVVALAQPLADRVPADACYYWGWRGIAAMGPEYEASHLKGFLQATQFVAKLNTLLDITVTAAAHDQPDFGADIRFAKELGAAVWTYPTAAYLVFPTDKPQTQPRPTFVVLIDAQASAPALLERLQLALPPANPQYPLSLTQQGDLVIFTSELNPDVRAKLGAKLAAPLSESVPFLNSLAQCRKNPSGMVYINASLVMGLINQAVAVGADAQVKQKWPLYRDALGLKGLNSMMFTAGFDGADWATATFIDAPAPRTGILKFFDPAPLTQDTLKLVCKDAPWFSASRLDLAALMHEVHATIAQVDPTTAAQIDSALLNASAEAGFDIEADLIQNLGSEWVRYSDPSAAGVGGAGMILINRVKDAAKVDQALTALEALFNQRMNQGPQQGPFNFRMQVAQQDGVTIHFLATPFFSPSWAVYDGKLIFSTSTQGVIVAARYRATEPGSILDNPKFIAMSQQLGTHAAICESFADLHQTAPQIYGMMVMTTQMLAMANPHRDGQPSPAALLPPLVAILPYLSRSANCFI